MLSARGAHSLILVVPVYIFKSLTPLNLFIITETNDQVIGEISLRSD